MVIQDVSFFSEITNEELTEISGGVSVPTTNQIINGGAIIRVDLRSGLKNKTFTGSFQNCTADFGDFDGVLSVSCALSPGVVNSGALATAQSVAS